MPRATTRKRSKKTTTKSLVPAARRAVISLAEKKANEQGPIAIPTWNTPYVSGVAAIPSTSWYFGSVLNNIPQGTARNQRIGNRIFAKYLLLTLRFRATDNITPGAFCRYVVLLNKDTNRTIASGSDVFSQSCVPDSGGINAYSLRNHDTLKKYSVLLDKQHLITQWNTGGPTGPCMTVQHYVPINKHIQYTGTGIGNDSAGNLLTTDVNIGLAASAGSCCEVLVGWRLVFTDA